MASESAGPSGVQASRIADERLSVVIHELRNAVGTIGTALSLIEAHRWTLKETLEIGTRQIVHITQFLDARLEGAEFSR